MHESVKRRMPAAMAWLMANLLLFKDVGSHTRPRAGLLPSHMHTSLDEIMKKHPFLAFWALL